MRIANEVLKTSILAVMAVWSANPCRASYDYTIGDGGLVSGFSVSVDGASEQGVLVGGIKATASGQGVPGYSSFTTVCEDLSGRLHLGSTYAFNETAFSGQTGLNPSWGNPLASPPNPATAYEAINNAAFLFASHENLSSSTDWAALQLAVWKAVYDTGANGQIVWGNNARFTVGYDPTGAAWTEAQAWLSALPATQVFAGSILSPLDSTAQELLIGVTPVPEPATFISGALLLLPLGGSTLRLLRKRRGG